jgi:hypothetical protein
VLLVLGTQSAIEWATKARLDAHPHGQFPWREKLISIEPRGIAADEVFALAVDRAAFTEVDAAVAGDDFGGDKGYWGGVIWMVYATVVLGARSAARRG